MSAALSVADTVTAEPATDSPPAAESATEFPNAGVIITPQWLQFPLGVPRVVISRDTRIGDPTVSYKDPEFLVAERLVTWQDGENQIWVCRFDPLTGAFLPADGRGWLVAQGAAPLLHFEERLAGTVINGPEFGLTRRDLAVYFCHGSDPANYQVAKVSLRSRELEILAPGLTNGTRGLFAAQDRSDRYGRVMHIRTADRPDGGFDAIPEWFEEDDQTVMHPLPRSTFGTNGPRWIPGERAIVSNLNDSMGVPQIVRYDIDTEEMTYLTSGPEPKVDGIFFEAPELLREQLFLCLENDGQYIGIYRRQGRVWSRIRQIFSPDFDTFETPPRVLSPEPVFHLGRTYFSYTVGYADRTSRIALASLNGSVNALVSAPSRFRQVDPEAVSVGANLFVYYWMFPNLQRIHELHRCQIRVLP